MPAIDWIELGRHPAHYFPWSEVRAAYESRDAQVTGSAVRAAQKEFATRAMPCQGCGGTTLEWIAIGTIDDAFAAGDERCGWLTVCVPCARQVTFINDEVSVELRRQGNW
jgi:hypothetical protein